MLFKTIGASAYAIDVHIVQVEVDVELGKHGRFHHGESCPIIL
jgi:hypothetical protein